jgi:hypothetical protein
MENTNLISTTYYNQLLVPALDILSCDYSACFFSFPGSRCWQLLVVHVIELEYFFFRIFEASFDVVKRHLHIPGETHWYI